MNNDEITKEPKSNGHMNWVRLVSDLGPAAAFLIGYNFAPKFFPADPITHDPKPILVATLFFLPASIIAFIFSWVKTRKISPIGIFTFVMILIMSGLGLWLKNDVFIKMKSTLIFSIMGLVLLVSVAMRHNLLKTLLDAAIHMDEKYWRILTIRAGILYLCLAGLNELVWRTQSEANWVLFHFWGDFIINTAFWVINIFMLAKHMTDENGKPLLEE